DGRLHVPGGAEERSRAGGHPGGRHDGARSPGARRHRRPGRPSQAAEAGGPAGRHSTRRSVRAAPLNQHRPVRRRISRKRFVTWSKGELRRRNSDPACPAASRRPGACSEGRRGWGAGDMKIGLVAGRVFVGRALVVSSLLGLVACGGGSQTPPHAADGSSPVSPADAAMLPTTGPDTAPIVTGVDGGAPPSVFDGGGTTPLPDAGRPVTPTDAGSIHMSVDAMSACGLPPPPADLCTAVPTGKVAPCSESGGQPSQTGYLEIDRPGSAPVYVCATSWNPDPSIGYIFGQPGTFMSDPQSCCGGAASPTAAPTAPDLSLGSVGAPHIPAHVKPPEMQQPGGVPLRHNPFAIAVTDTKSGAAATAAISMWKSWGGDAQPHTAPD